MNMEEFTLWLYGYLWDKNRELTKEETQTIKVKLDNCFNKITPKLQLQPQNLEQIPFDKEPYCTVIDFKKLEGLNSMDISQIGRTC